MSDRVLAPFGRRLLTVTSAEEVGAYVVLSAADPDGPVPAAGQFFMLAAQEGWGTGGGRPFLPRAFSVLRREGDELRFLLEDIGPGTGRLCALRPGDGLWVAGPLGAGFGEPPDGHRAVLCGGGVGVPPLACLQDALRAAGRDHVALLGFRSGAHAEAAALLTDARVATDDGSAGHHGLVTELLEEELDASPAATVYACGPPAMLEAVRMICERRGVPGRLALEAGMACGYGACFGCVVPLREGGYARVCVDGPVLDAAVLAEVPAH